MKLKILLIIPIFLLVLVAYLIGMYCYKIERFLSRKKTVEDIIDQYEKKVDSVFNPIFERNNIAYPPENLVLIGLKEEKILEVWTLNHGKTVFIKSYPFTTISGKQGPKLIRGDGQIPEGLYRIESLNPNSAFHLSLKINYPNEFDLEKAKIENRKDPGDNIFIHGKDKSIGCVAIGDEAIDELFVLAAKIRRYNVEVLLLPYDLRTKPVRECEACPGWTKELYDKLKVAAKEFRKLN